MKCIIYVQWKRKTNKTKQKKNRYKNESLGKNTNGLQLHASNFFDISNAQRQAGNSKEKRNYMPEWTYKYYFRKTLKQ